MNILVIPTTDWTRHPVPNRLNFIFDHLAESHEVHVLHFSLKRFRDVQPRDTRCHLIETGWIDAEDPSLYYLLNFPSHLHRIREAVREERIDLILSTNILPSLAANITDVPIVFDYLDHLEESASVYYPGSILGRLVRASVGSITRYNLRHARSVITVTEELAGFLRGVGVRDITVIPNGVDTRVLRPLPKEEAKASLGIEGNVLGYVGSLEHWVDLETVVQALTGVDASLLVVGPGLFTDYGSLIKHLAEDLGVADRVVFAGPVRYQDLSRYISAMDVGLNPLKRMKKNEYAAGGKVFNYLACGRPVLSSRMVSLERLLGDELYYYDGAESLIEQAERLLALQPDEARYRSIALRYDWSALAERYGEVLERSAEMDR
ncbi:MAG: glycosyltransferase [Methanothrix sp.]|nr:glycosyltransferase [Methanothrix sp.]